MNYINTFSEIIRIRRPQQKKQNNQKKCNTGTHLLVYVQFSVYCLSAERLVCFLNLNTLKRKLNGKTSLSETSLFCSVPLPPQRVWTVKTLNSCLVTQSQLNSHTGSQISSETPINMTKLLWQNDKEESLQIDFHGLRNCFSFTII